MEKLDINKYEIKEILKFFKEISRIPRESGNEEKIKNYLVKFAKDREYDYEEDKDFNVIIKKSASEGMENEETICLQGHTDMICEKIEGLEFDFSKDSIELYTDGKWIFANGTTLGADNGIGMAIILAILDNKNVKLPAIEAVFTVEEETTMKGAINIDFSNLKSKKIISIDGGNAQKVLIGSANCLEWSGTLKKEFDIIPNNFNLYKLEYSEFLGGHSGGDIGDLKRGNPIKLGINVIKNIKNLYIKNIKGGSRVNVIPRDAVIEFAMLEDDEEEVKQIIKTQQEFFENNGKIELKKLNLVENETCYSKELTKRIINFVSKYENGALEYNSEKDVILSCNMADIKEDEKNIIIEFSTRSNNMELRNKYLKRLEKIIEENQIQIVWKQELKGIEQDKNNELINKCCNAYKDLYKKEMEKIITQGVIEGGFFADKIENLEYICLGTNLENAHSPSERVEIDSIGKIYNLIEKILTKK